MEENKQLKNYNLYFLYLISILIYALLVRFGLELYVYDHVSIVSWSFLVIIPFIIGIIPILDTRTQIYQSYFVSFFYPSLSNIIYLLILLTNEMEDLFCVLFIGVTFQLISGIVGVCCAAIVRSIKKKNEKNTYVLFLLPFITMTIESNIEPSLSNYTVSNQIIIHKSNTEIYPQLLEVPYINEDNYSDGFFQYIGIPRPLHSKIFEIDGERYRLGYFTEGLILYETILEEILNQYVSFHLDLQKSTLRDKPTDRHVLKENKIRFNKITYQLESIAEDKTLVILTCDYSVESNINFYINFWAKNLIDDFEVRLLQSLSKVI